VAFAHAEASFEASCSRKRWLKTRSGMASVPAIQCALAFCRGMIAAVRQVADTAHGRIANCIAVRLPQLHQLFLKDNLYFSTITHGPYSVTQRMP
jgi:hypothetical protein